MCLGTTDAEVDVVLDDVTALDRDRCVALARVVPSRIDESRPADELAIIRLFVCLFVISFVFNLFKLCYIIF